jgi:hypothetical protein
MPKRNKKHYSFHTFDLRKQRFPLFACRGNYDNLQLLQPLSYLQLSISDHKLYKGIALSVNSYLIVNAFISLIRIFLREEFIDLAPIIEKRLSKNLVIRKNLHYTGPDQILPVPLKLDAFAQIYVSGIAIIPLPTIIRSWCRRK